PPALPSFPTRRSSDLGAIDPWRMPRYENKRRALAEFAKRERIPTDVAWQKLPDAQRHKLLHGRARGYKGIFPFLSDLEEKRYKRSEEHTSELQSLAYL